MSRFREIRGIYFDLWNTLAWTDHDPHPITALASAIGLDASPEWRPAMEAAIMTRRLSGIGEAIDVLASGTGAALSGSWTRHELILLWGAASNRNRIYPDVLPALSALRSARTGGRSRRLGILSNTQSFDLDFLAREGLSAFMDEICLSCDTGLLKPDPDFFRLAADRMELAPRHILMVGDRPVEDVEGSRDAGMQAVLIDRSSFGMPPGIAGGAPVISTLTDLPGLLAARRDLNGVS